MRDLSEQLDTLGKDEMRAKAKGMVAGQGDYMQQVVNRKIRDRKDEDSVGSSSQDGDAAEFFTTAAQSSDQATVPCAVPAESYQDTDQRGSSRQALQSRKAARVVDARQGATKKILSL